MRTAADVFEEVLAIWDDAELTAIMTDSPPGVGPSERLARLEAHAAKVRAYREEFREANEEGIMQALRTAQSFEDSRGAVEEPAEESEARIPAVPQPAQVIDLMEALKASLAAAGPRRESIAERSERLAERHTRDDGSSR
jgi:hypothetical protein